MNDDDVARSTTTRAIEHEPLESEQQLNDAGSAAKDLEQRTHSRRTTSGEEILPPHSDQHTDRATQHEPTPDDEREIF